MTAHGMHRAISRRRFAQAVGTTIAAAWVPGSVLSAATSATALPLHLVYDRRVLDPAHVLPGVNDRHVAARHAFEGDVSALWRDVLEPLWARHASVTLGYTRHAEFFVLRTLAREQDYVLASLQQSGDRFRWRLIPRAPG